MSTKKTAPKAPTAKSTKTPTVAATAKRAAKSSATAGNGTPPQATDEQVVALTKSLQVKQDESPWTPAELREVGEALREEIEAYRREIQAAELDLEDLISTSIDGAGDDQADAGAKTFERDHEIALTNNSRDMLRQAERALDLLLAGTYGVCENCGKPIGKGRLQAFPRATLCLPCKTKQERH